MAAPAIDFMDFCAFADAKGICLTDSKSSYHKGAKPQKKDKTSLEEHVLRVELVSYLNCYNDAVALSGEEHLRVDTESSFGDAFLPASWNRSKAALDVFASRVQGLLAEFKKPMNALAEYTTFPVQQLPGFDKDAADFADRKKGETKAEWQWRLEYARELEQKEWAIETLHPAVDFILYMYDVGAARGNVENLELQAEAERLINEYKDYILLSIAPREPKWGERKRQDVVADTVNEALTHINGAAESEVQQSTPQQQLRDHIWTLHSNGVDTITADIASWFDSLSGSKQDDIKHKLEFVKLSIVDYKYATAAIYKNHRRSATKRTVRVPRAEKVEAEINATVYHLAKLVGVSIKSKRIKDPKADECRNRELRDIPDNDLNMIRSLQQQLHELRAEACAMSRYDHDDEQVEKGDPDSNFAVERVRKEQVRLRDVRRKFKRQEQFRQVLISKYGDDVDVLAAVDGSEKAALAIEHGYQDVLENMGFIIMNNMVVNLP
jgi:hypothetical protein